MKNDSKRIENPYGYHDIAAREFVITRPDTPTPWINYLGEGRYGGIISNTGGGFAFDRDPRNRRVSRYRYNSIPVDQPGRYIYLRDQETGNSGVPPGSRWSAKHWRIMNVAMVPLIQKSTAATRAFLSNYYISCQ